VGDLSRWQLERWVRDHAAEVELDDPDQSPWSALDELAERARVAYVAESHHFVREKYAVRRAAVRWLAARGWTWFGEELGWTDGVRVDRGELDRVPTYGHLGARRSDRHDRPWGILDTGDGGEPADGFVRAQIAFARSLQHLGVRWFGFDVDGWTTAAVELLRELGAAEGLDPVPGESLQEEADRVATVAAGRIGSLPPAAARALDAYATTLAYAVQAYPATAWEQLRPAMATREQLMWRHVDAVLDDPAFAGPGAKVALLAGSLHLLKDDTAAHDETPAIGPGGGLVPSIGHHVAHRADVGADRVLAIWMLCGRGRDASPLAADRAGIAPLAGSLNAACDRVADGVPIVVPLAGLPGRVRIQHMHSSVVRTRAAGQIDAIVYVPEVTPLA
jgi:hypothetical protein